MKALAGGVALVFGFVLLSTSIGLGGEEATPETSVELYAFIYRPGPAWRQDVPMNKQGLGPHASYMQELLERGHIFAAGGFADGDGGMAIVRAANADEARRLLAADPAVASGIFVGELEHWKPRFRASGPLLDFN